MRVGLVVAGSLALAAVVSVLHHHVTSYLVMSGFLDLEVYRAGAQAFLAGQPLYDGKIAGGAFAFTYPPFAAVLFTPLALGPVQLWQALVFLANLALLCTAVRLCLRTARRLEVLGLSAVLFWLEPVSWTVYLGQINLLLLVLLLWDLGSDRPGRWRGIGVGIAAGLKLTPLIFVVYLLVTRQFRAALVAAATTAVTVLIGLVFAPADTLRYWSGTFLRAERVGEVASAMNQSINGVLARLLAVPQPPTWLWLAVAVPVAVLGLLVAARAHRGGDQLLAITVCGLTGAAVSPISWSHHWVWFVPLAILLYQRSPRLAAGLVLVLFAWPVHFLTGHRMDVPALGLIGLPAWHGLELIWANLYLLVLGATFWMVRGSTWQARRGSPSATSTAQPYLDA
ncbi:DUF2029 domain-containing protein [Lentzea tibetensis]|uniref:DUF2029 domain-containing protein n=1 Tax=Lentzea tibetensis TaxID=2591470 RepID=A0A563F1B4_9PSEU|nr:glycosyltransferase 87 family protein [Lentzea tibetensis]TWP53767.1 DUF2029 domain-containing protein [Lentzea tibetensis]